MGSGNSKDFDANVLLRGGGHRMFANLGPCKQYLYINRVNI